jgi:hypothetical protein
MNATPDDYPIIDGFLLNTQLKCDLTFFALAIEEFRALRRSGSYRTRCWCIPNDPSQIANAIPPRDTVEFQVYCEPGSAIWAYSFPAPRNQYSFQVTDACTDVPLLSEPVFSLGGVRGSQAQQLLSKLLIVSKPGLLNVQISSVFAAEPLGIQLVLWGGEPTGMRPVCS